MTFGKVIAEARKKLKLSQKDLAALIIKEDGQAISPQYLNDIERDRRNPTSDFLTEQFAKVLNVPVEILCYHAGELPADIKGIKADDKNVIAAYKAFRKALGEDKKK